MTVYSLKPDPISLEHFKWRAVERPMRCLVDANTEIEARLLVAAHFCSKEPANKDETMRQSPWLDNSLTLCDSIASFGDKIPDGQIIIDWNFGKTKDVE